MTDYSKKSNYELEELYKSGEYSDSLESELIRRGYEQDKNGYWEFEEKYNPSEAYGDFEFGLDVFKVVLIIALVVALLWGGITIAHIFIGYADRYATLIYSGFGLSFLLMYYFKGKSKFANFIFYLGNFALATRMFTFIICNIENKKDFATYFFDADLGTLTKYTIIYIIYILIVPKISTSIITGITRKIIESKYGDGNLTINS